MESAAMKIAKALTTEPPAPPIKPPIEPPTPPIPEDTLGILKEILKEIKTMSFAPTKEMLFKYFCYPSDGTRKTLPAGTTLIDFYTGRVTLPDGTIEHLSSSLENYKEWLVHSLFIETNKDIVAQVDPFGKIPVDADDFLLMTWINFKQVYIYTTEDTEVFVEACTNPSAVLHKLMTPVTKTTLPITRTTDSKDLSTGALSKTTALTTRFRLLSVLIHFDAAVSPTVTLTLDSKSGANYDTVLKKNTLAAATDYVFIGGDGYTFEKDDQIKVDVTSVAATAYLTILTEEV
jgi:hypothetical protein